MPQDLWEAVILWLLIICPHGLSWRYWWFLSGALLGPLGVDILVQPSGGLIWIRKPFFSRVLIIPLGIARESGFGFLNLGSSDLFLSLILECQKVGLFLQFGENFSSSQPFSFFLGLGLLEIKCVEFWQATTAFFLTMCVPPWEAMRDGNCYPGKFRKLKESRINTLNNMPKYYLPTNEQ